MSQLFTSRGQRIGVSASTSVLPMNTAFTESHRFWVVMFSFSFVSMHILISSLISSDLLVIQQLVVQPPYVGIFDSISPVIEI